MNNGQQNLKHRKLLALYLFFASYLLVLSNCSIIVSVSQSSKIVSKQERITATVRTNQTITDLRFLLSTDFTLVLDDGTPTDNKNTSCYLGNASLICTSSVSNQNYLIIFPGLVLAANTDYLIGLQVKNPYYSDNFQLQAYSGSVAFFSFGLIAIQPQQINCSIIMGSSIVGEATTATFSFQLGESPPSQSVLFLSASIPTNGFNNMFNQNPICDDSIQPTPNEYSCDLSLLFENQVLTINGIFPVIKTTLQIRISTINNPPFNATWNPISVQINDQFGRKIKYGTANQPAPTVLRTSTLYNQTGWNSTIGATSTVQSTLTTYFSPLSTVSILIIYPLQLSISPSPPAVVSNSSVYNSSSNMIIFTNLTTNPTNKLIQWSSAFTNPLSTISLPLDLYVLFNSTNYIQKYTLSSNNMKLIAGTHSFSTTLSNYNTAAINIMNVTITLTSTSNFTSINDRIILSLTIQKGTINCNNLSLIDIFAGGFTVSNCNSSYLQVTSNNKLSGTSIWITFNYTNYFSIAPNSLKSELTTLSGNSISQANFTLTLIKSTCQFSITNLSPSLLSTSNLTLIQTVRTGYSLINSTRKIILTPPNNVQPLSLNMVGQSKSTNSKLNTFQPTIGSLILTVTNQTNVQLNNFNNPNDYTNNSRIWTINISDTNGYSSMDCTATMNPDFTAATSKFNYSLSNSTIQQSSQLFIKIQSVLNYVADTSFTPIVTLSLGSASIADISSSLCGAELSPIPCKRVTSSFLNSTFGGIVTILNMSIINSPDPTGNQFIIKVIHPITGFVYQQAIIDYTLTPLQFTFVSSFNGLYGQLGQLDINVTSKPNRTISLTYVQSDINIILADSQCLQCTGDRIYIQGIVKNFYETTVTIRGVGTNGLIYAQSKVAVAYPCPWRGCRICDTVYQANSTVGNQVCLKCFDQTLSNFSHLYNNLCYQTCPSKTYATSTSCLPCPDLCYSCSQTQCLQCDPGYYVFSTSGTCIQNCPSGYITNSTHCFLRQIVCNTNCVQCVKDYTCDLCNDGYKLLEQICYQTCPSGYVTDPFSDIPKCAVFVPPQQASFFPFIFIIISILWLLILWIFKCFQKRSLMMGNFIALMPILEWAAIILLLALIYNKNDPYNQTNTPELTLTTQAFTFIIILTKILFNVIFFIYFFINIRPENNFQQWSQKSTAHRILYFSCLTLSLVLSFQIIRLMYSRLFGLEIFFGKFNNALIFKPINFFSLGYALLVATSIIALCGIAIYNEDGYHTTLFFSAVELIILEIILVIATFIDAKWGKGDQYFHYQVYKVENQGASISENLQAIEVKYQQQNGGSYHQFLRSAYKPAVKNDWVAVESQPRIYRNQSNQQQSNANLQVQDGDGDEPYQQLPALEISQMKKSSLFRWKIIEDWNKLRQSLPQKIVASRKSLINKSQMSISPQIQISKRQVSPKLKRVSSVEQIKKGKVVSPMALFLKKVSGRDLKAQNSSPSPRKDYYEINKQAHKTISAKENEDQLSSNRIQSDDRTNFEKENRQQESKQLGYRINNRIQEQQAHQYKRNNILAKQYFELKSEGQHFPKQQIQEQELEQDDDFEVSSISYDSQSQKPNIEVKQILSREKYIDDKYNQPHQGVQIKQKKKRTKIRKQKKKNINKQTEQVYLQRLQGNEQKRQAPFRYRDQDF